MHSFGNFVSEEYNQRRKLPRDKNLKLSIEFESMMSLKINVVALAVLVIHGSIQIVAGDRQQGYTPQQPKVRLARSDHHHHTTMMHNHLSRKIFDRACAASKDTIDEVIACLTGNETLKKTVKEETAKKCYKDSFGMEFDPKDVSKHKDLMCNNRDKFESMTTCIYKKTADALGIKEIEKMAEAMVDVGLCIINALDG